MRKNTSMKKTRNQDERIERTLEYPFQIPYTVSIDELAVISDEELSDHYTMLNQQRNELLKKRYPTYCWDVELAYAQRELKIRNDRRVQHNRFMENLQSEIQKFHATEAFLPEFEPSPAMMMELN